MKKPSRLIGLMALASMTAFMAGCGDDDDGDGGDGGGTPQTFAPADQNALEANTYTITSAGGTNSTLTLSGGGNYTLTTAGQATETGTYTATKNGEEWTIVATPSGGGDVATLRLLFTANNAGNFTLTRGANAPESGTFTAQSSSPDPTPDPGPGPEPAPDPTPTGSLQGRTMSVNATTGPFAPNTYTISFTSATAFSGVFDTGASAGSGTYTYNGPATPSAGSSATLVLNYTNPAGDRDTMNLSFTSATAGTFTGSQFIATDNMTHNNFAGSFTLQ